MGALRWHYVQFSRGPISASLGAACAGCLCPSAPGVQERIYTGAFVGPDGATRGRVPRRGGAAQCDAIERPAKREGGGDASGVAE
ncbi:unnamed protein product, partial [Iphiclides podalirius]